MDLRTIALAAGLLTSAGALAQESKPAEPAKPAPTPAQPEQPKDAKPKPEQPPSLDDLLGLPADKKPTSPNPDAKPAKPAPDPRDPNQAALERMLTQQEMAEQFEQAARLMAQTADRLEQSRDTSIQTQRIQDDIIRKLDQIIADAKKQQKQSRSKSSSKQNQQGDQQQEQPQQQSQAQQNEQRSNSPAQQAGQAPTGNDAQLNPEVARGAQWGNLPARYRDALLQGNNDRFSLMYKQWTEAYYKRLAEEAGK
jgi:hypothetical protein